MPKQIISFGSKYGVPVQEQDGPSIAVIDVSKLLRNPFHIPELQSLNGLEEKVQEYVKGDKSFAASYGYIKRKAEVPGVDIVYVGCRGGKHRSVTVVELLKKDLGDVEISHRDINKK